MPTRARIDTESMKTAELVRSIPIVLSTCASSPSRDLHSAFKTCQQCCSSEVLPKAPASKLVLSTFEHTHTCCVFQYRYILYTPHQAASSVLVKLPCTEGQPTSTVQHTEE
jgi:hypothetical protein